MDKREQTSKFNGSKGGRPTEWLEFTDFPGEQWVRISGYLTYFISDTGRLMSITTGTPRIKKFFDSGTGYLKVRLHWAGERKIFFVHRLVLEAFVGPCPRGCEGSHLDGDRQNNHLGNLVWESPLANNARKKDHGTAAVTCGEGNGNSKLTVEKVRKIRGLFATGDYTREQLGAHFNVSPDTIGRAVLRKTWAHVK